MLYYLEGAMSDVVFENQTKGTGVSITQAIQSTADGSTVRLVLADGMVTAFDDRGSTFLFNGLNITDPAGIATTVYSIVDIVKSFGQKCAAGLLGNAPGGGSQVCTQTVTTTVNKDGSVTTTSTMTCKTT
jgi:hypothetical protein